MHTENKGFTLIELMVVFSIILILMSFMIPGMYRIIKSVNSYQTQFENIKSATYDSLLPEPLYSDIELSDVLSNIERLIIK